MFCFFSIKMRARTEKLDVANFNKEPEKFPSDSNSVSINYFTPMNSFFERDLEQLFWDWPIDYHKHFFTHEVTTVTFGLIFLYTQYSDYFVDSYRGADIYRKKQWR